MAVTFTFEFVFLESSVQGQLAFIIWNSKEWVFHFGEFQDIAFIDVNNLSAGWTVKTSAYPASGFYKFFQTKNENIYLLSDDLTSGHYIYKFDIMEKKFNLFSNNVIPIQANVRHNHKIVIPRTENIICA